MSNAGPIWRNGRLLPDGAGAIAASDRGFTLGDGVFETMRVHRGAMPWLADHLTRLREGAALLAIPVPLDDAAIGDGLTQLVATSHDTASLRLTLSRGPAARGLWPAGEASDPTLLATLGPAAPPRPALELIISRQTRRNEHSPLSRVKSLNYGDNLLARREAARRGADDALMLNTAGRLACGTVGNLFLRVAGAWVTPPIPEGVLPGLARARLLPRLRAAEIALPEDALAGADAGFLSNSLGLAPIAAIDGRKLSDIGSFLETLRLFD